MNEERLKQSETEQIANGNLYKAILKFTATTLVALILNSVYNLTDTLFVSRGVGDYAMGGVSIVFPFVILQSAIATAVGGGAASLVSRKLGENNKKEAGAITLNAMLIFYITAIITTVFGFVFMRPILLLCGVTEELYPYAKEYFVIILAGTVFSTGFSSIIRAEGKMTYGLLIWVIPITINIFLDAIFILVLDWGVKGSALATVICQFISFCMSILFFTKFSILDFKGARLRIKRIASIIGIGFPSLVQMGSLSVITIILNSVLRSVGGTIGITAFGYISKILTYVIVPFTAIAQALAPIVGYSYGSHNFERAKKAIIFCILISFIYAVFIILVAEIVPQYFIMIFTDNAEIIAVGANGIKIVAISVLFTPLPMLMGANFQAQGRKLWSLLMYASNLIFLMPLLFIIPIASTIMSVWWAYVIATVCSTVLAAIRLSFTSNRLKEMKT